MTFSQREFRDALGVFPTGVAVVTAATPGGLELGITVNSFASVSLDPPLVSFNVARTLKSFDEFMQCKAFAVNVLREEQSALSHGFGRPNGEKWATVERRVGRTACPILEPHLAAFECESYATFEAGDHVIIVGRVVHFEVSDTGSALVFYRGAYHRVGETLFNKQSSDMPPAEPAEERHRRAN